MPDNLQFAASFDWEALLPVLFFLLYGISQLFGSKKKKGEDSPEDEDALERARQIREEIRRKIEARKQAAGGSSTGSQPEYDPTLPDGQQRRPRPQQQPTMAQPRSKPVEKPVRRESKPAPVYQQKQAPRSGREKSLEEMLEEQRRQVEKSRERMKEARARSREIQKAGPKGEVKEANRKIKLGSHVTGPGSSEVRKQLLRGLHNPDSLRQAILFKEILGKPLGLR